MIKNSLIDVIAEKMANGWEHGTHPREKARIVLDAIRQHEASVCARPQGDTSEMLVVNSLLLTAIYKDIEAETIGNGHPIPTEVVETLAQSIMGTIAPFLKRESSGRPYPELLSDEEKKALLEKAEGLWYALDANNLGGFSGINRPFFILSEFKEVIEAYGKRDVGLTWSSNDLRKARKTDNQIEGGAS